MSIDDIDVEQLIEDVKKEIKDITFTDDMFYLECQKYNVDMEDSWKILKAICDVGVVSYIGMCGPPDCPDMFCEFKFN